MKSYDHKKIEKKWQDVWAKNKLYEAKNNSKKDKYYGLIEFPYPSGAGLHVGHIRSITAMDIICRKRRMEGFNVLYPIGWDAFGLPTENYAIKTGISPEEVTKQNTNTFRKQLKQLGFSFDWSREINTTDPEYYKWTQWIFLKMFEKGLAYKDKTIINWCPACKIGLANEEVVDGNCERCGTETTKKEKEQWMLKITEYADRLDKDLDLVDFLERVKIQQRNWIGKSEGSDIDFEVKNSDLKIKIFTTRADTLFGATYTVLSPEHSLLNDLDFDNKEEVEKYIKEVKKKTEIERTAEDKEKTGVELKGVKAINPANNEEISIFVADYVLPQYGTGAVMAVPAHDLRDFEFAKKYKLEIKKVIELTFTSTDRIDTEKILDAVTEEGFLCNSNKFNGLSSKEAKKEITKKVNGKLVTKYKLRDWIFSRQRYWGEPIPIIDCEKCGHVPVPEKDLPVELPKVKSYQLTETGESPLADISKWVSVKCPKCKGEAKRETDTMPNWAGSSWYYLRYIDPNNKKELVDSKKLDYWKDVDWYNGGMEHTTLHLLYSRFWHKFLYDIGVVKTKEPYRKRTAHGMILAEDGQKMSKSRNNIINPDDIIRLYGADTLRLYEMFIGPFDQAISWNTDSIIGPRRFLEKIWRIELSQTSEDVEKLLHKTIKKVSEDIESMNFNTAISSMMMFINEVEKKGIGEKEFNIFLKLFSPFAPHLTEELFKGKESIHLSDWPKYDKIKIIEDEIKIAVQVNGKVRSEIIVIKDEDEEAVKAKANKEILGWIEGKDIKKVIYVPNKIINIVVN
ncbi:MAG: leucine--tRNA ligase [Patescibacteria group bacterium]|nr:leucine--tRNA ligase [Patescibacteria group bacterium]